MDFPPSTIICPTNEEYEWLFTYTRHYEKLYFPQYYQDYGQVELEDQFTNNTALKDSYCDINAQEVLKINYEEYKKFFASLRTY